MKSHGFLLIDGNNIAHAANHGKALAVGGQPTQAIFTMLRTMRSTVSTFHMLTPIVLWDGASWRKKIFPAYKARREKPPEKKYEIEAQKKRDELRAQLPHIKRALSLVGIRQMLAINYEADDLAGLLVERWTPGRRIMLLTGDTDWVQLLRTGVGWLDPVRGTRITAGTIEQKIGYEKKDVGWVGVPGADAWLQVKALMGDTTDEVPGVGGIGEKGAIDLIRQYGSVKALSNATIDGTIKVETLPKKYRDLITSDEKMEIFHRNLRLMDLSGRERPTPIQLTVTPGKLDMPEFGKFCDEFMFNSIRNDLEGWCEPFSRILQ